MIQLHSSQDTYVVLERRDTHIYVQGQSYRCGFYFEKYPDLQFQNLQVGDKLLHSSILTLPNSTETIPALQNTEPVKSLPLRKYSITTPTE